MNNIVFTTANNIEAGIVRGVLESHGIEVHVFDENIGRMQPFFNLAIGGIKLVVPDQQLKEAREILKIYSKSQNGEILTGQLSPFDFLGKTKAKRSGIVTLLLSVLLFPIILFQWFGFKNYKKHTKKKEE